MAIKDCIICGRSFEARNPRHQTCGEPCAYQSRLVRQAAYKKNNPEKVSEWNHTYDSKRGGRLFVLAEVRMQAQIRRDSKEPLPFVNCAVCGAGVKASYRNQRTCLARICVVTHRENRQKEKGVRKYIRKAFATRMHAALADARDHFPELFDQKGSEP